MRRALATAIAAAIAAAALPHAAGAAGINGYDGKNPFACTLQQLGTGTDFPEPNVDPFCVEYDKRHQNVTQLGVVDFLSQEPARVAATKDKCFYFQRDHWVGSVVQDNQQTQTYRWDGSYYYDEAKGTGGVFVENFSVNGKSGDPTQLPDFPYKQFFGNGRGGIQADNNVPVNPSCAAKAKAHSPYAVGGPGTGNNGTEPCRVPGGQVTRGIGGITLGQRRRDVRKTLGPPSKESKLYVDYCMTGGGQLIAGFGKSGGDGRALLVWTNARPFDAGGIRTGDDRKQAHKKLGHFEWFVKTTKGMRLVGRRDEDRLLLVGSLHEKVRFLAIMPPDTSRDDAIRVIGQRPH